MVTAMATVIAMGQWGTRSIDRVLCCNSDGAKATAVIDRFHRDNGNGATGATAIAMGHWGTGAGATATAIAMAMAMAMAMGRNDRSCFYIATQNVDNSGC
jgi:hypothetical protein